MASGPDQVRSLVHSAGVSGLGRRMRLSTLFDRAWDHLLRAYRCEYIYKNTITNDLLLKKHGIGSDRNAARLLTEFWVDDVRADIAVINGTSTVYEIKTDYDSINRLADQVAGYSKLFDKVFVVTSPRMEIGVAAVLPDHVGLLVFEADGQMREVKRARSNKEHVDVEVVFRSMRQLEVLEICRRRSGQPLDMANGLRIQACWDIFKILSPQEAHQEMVRALRAREIHAAQRKLVEKAPGSLKHLCLGKAMSVRQYQAILPQFEVAV